MVLEHRERRGGTGGEIETHKEEESGGNEKVESWSTVAPLAQTMMGLYYPTMLLVSSILKQSFFSMNKCVHMLRIAGQDQERQ